jgi:hypothetical protein
MAAPTQMSAFDHREFRVIIARVGSRIVARAWDRSRKLVAEVNGTTSADVEAEVKHQLNRLSEDYIGVSGTINLFRKAFPGGFECWYYADRERDYKDGTARIVAEVLDEGHLRGLIDAGEHGEVATLAVRALAACNLCPWQEQHALNAALATGTVAAPFARGLHRLLYEDFDPALEELASLLKPYNAAKWTVLTYWPFFRFPERHMFMQPVVARKCAARMGYELHYESTPNRETYRSLLGLSAFVREGIAALEPKDNIDMQSFIYVIGKEGYVRQAVEDREGREVPD